MTQSSSPTRPRPRLGSIPGIAESCRQRWAVLLAAANALATYMHSNVPSSVTVLVDMDGTSSGRADLRHASQRQRRHSSLPVHEEVLAAISRTILSTVLTPMPSSLAIFTLPFPAALASKTCA